MRSFNDIMDDLLDLVEEEDLIVTSGLIQFEGDEVYAGRVEYDGVVRGVISYNGMEDALARAADKMYYYFNGGEEEEHFDVSTRHIQSLRATVDELGFDRAVALLERLNK